MVLMQVMHLTQGAHLRYTESTVNERAAQAAGGTRWPGI